MDQSINIYKAIIFTNSQEMNDYLINQFSRCKFIVNAIDERLNDFERKAIIQQFNSNQMSSYMY